MFSSSTIDIHFRIQISQLCSSEVVCVVGNCEELGNWDVAKSLKLKKISTLGDGKEIWSNSLKLNPAQLSSIQYRYAICEFPVPSSGKDATPRCIVKKWETHLKARQIAKSSRASGDEVDLVDVPLDVFGMNCGMKCVDRGWLTSQTEIHLRLYHQSITLFSKKQQSNNLRLFLTILELHQNESNEDEPYWKEVEDPYVMITNLDAVDSSAQPQPPTGIHYNNSDFVTFRSQTLETEVTAFQLTFYQDASSTPLGTAFVLPLHLEKSAGKLGLSIVAPGGRPVGQVHLEYLVIKPCRNLHSDTKVSYTKYWNKKHPPMNIGHRGMGMSYKAEKLSEIRENTIEAFNQAAQHGAEFVEFDVVLSKDKIPVIYHDYVICVTVRKKLANDTFELCDVNIRELTVKQLQSLKVDHKSIKNKTDVNHRETDHSDPEELQHFPTLEAVLKKVDPLLGFNVEVKFPMNKVDGDTEQDTYFDRNEYVDAILNVLFAHAGQRRIVLSCFDPDTCSMLRKKQNKYPLLFLTQGVTDKWVAYSDPRTKTIPIAVQFAKSEDLLGIDVHTEDLIRDATQIDLARNSDLVIFCWGEHNNNTETLEWLRSHRLEGIIYDRMYEFSERKPNIFRQKAESKSAPSLLNESV